MVLSAIRVRNRRLPSLSPGPPPLTTPRDVSFPRRLENEVSLNRLASRPRPRPHRARAGGAAQAQFSQFYKQMEGAATGSLHHTKSMIEIPIDIHNLKDEVHDDDMPLVHEDEEVMPTLVPRAPTSSSCGSCRCCPPCSTRAPRARASASCPAFPCPAADARRSPRRAGAGLRISDARPGGGAEGRTCCSNRRR